MSYSVSDILWKVTLQTKYVTILGTWRNTGCKNAKKIHNEKIDAEADSSNTF